jgi:eukaryotic-like serine/threonine-protein kinase
MAELLENDPANRKTEPAAELPVIPEHQLVRLIGEGSGGQVWLARNAIGAYRAIKIVRKSAAHSGEHFAREFTGVLKFEPVSRLHDGLVDILQVGVAEAAGYFYCVMELADDAHPGQYIMPERYVPRTLAYDLSQGRRLPIGECVRNGAAIASALAFLHRHALIHRDIKPSNIIFVNGFPKLADIGLVSGISEPRSRIGTDGFIPPEGAGRPQADIYSLGKVLYQMSTGKDRNDYPELPADLGDSAQDRDLLRFNKIVLRACRTRPVRRFRSAEELLTALLSFQFATSELHRQESRKAWGRRIGLAGLVVVLGVLIFCVRRLIQLLAEGQ